ncbi:unnamed protein product [Closterium sp. Yama58-4]|nr:unnamed protein product [Closterium sp. Yama58-4]
MGEVVRAVEEVQECVEAQVWCRGCGGAAMQGRCGGAVMQGRCGGAVMQGRCGGAAMQGRCGGAAMQGRCGGAAMQGRCGGAAMQGRCGGAAMQGRCGGAAMQGRCGGAAMQGRCGGAAMQGRWAHAMVTNLVPLTPMCACWWVQMLGSITAHADAMKEKVQHMGGRVRALVEGVVGGRGADEQGSQEREGKGGAGHVKREEEQGGVVVEEELRVFVNDKVKKEAMEGM